MVYYLAEETFFFFLPSFSLRVCGEGKPVVLSRWRTDVKLEIACYTGVLYISPAYLAVCP